VHVVGRSFKASILVLLSFVAVARGADAPATLINASAVRETLDKLAGEDFLGREAGSEGGKKAGEWLASECEKLGLKPAGDDGTYFQNWKQGTRQLRNVVATLPAREDSECKDQVVVIGSHYDHLGKGGHGALDLLTGRSKVHYGADDNASGSTGNLLLARAFAAAGPQKRRLVFIWFDGEELGLYGSKRYVKKPTFPLEQTVAMLNMDMIGRLRNDKLTLYGSNTGSSFAGICKDAAEGLGLKLDVRDTMPPNSDHLSFYEKKIPVIALFTGLHKDYHRATDTADKVEPESVARVVRYGFGIVSRVLDLEEKPAFAKAKDGQAEAMLEQIQAMLGDDELEKIFGGEDGLLKLFKEGGIGKVMEKLRGGRKPRFGVSVEPVEGGKGVRVGRLTPASVAERAGVRVGDVIQTFDGHEIPDHETLVEAIRVAKGRVKLVVERDGETLTLDADFSEGAAPAPANPAPRKRWF
jgi:hypothetical protein